MQSASSSSHLTRRRRPDRACDACRRRKTKCDGPKMPDSICSNCSQSGRQCTYVEESKPRGPPKSYIIGLENKMEAMEILLQQSFPGSDFSEELGPCVIRDSWRNEGSTKHRSTPPNKLRATSSIASSSSLQPRPKLDDLATPYSLLPTPRLTLATVSDKKARHRQWDIGALDTSSSSDDVSSSDSEMGESAAHALTLRGTEEGVHNPESIRFHGRSSIPGITGATRKMKEMLLEDSQIPHSQSRLPDVRRPYFWHTPKWERDWENHDADGPRFLTYVLSKFPPPDLATSLINHYFRYLNPFYPVLHPPTFNRLYREGMHERDIWFAADCLCVFALASKWSEDVSVVPQDAKTATGDIDWGKAGWHYFNLVVDIHRVGRSLIFPATLFEIQTFPLLALFLRTTSAYIIGWIYVSVGLRKAQDIGAHRKRMYKDKSTVESELWKRAFWNLVLLDTLGATVLGRPLCVSQEEYDVDMPLEVDDEFWEPEDPTQAFQQPPGVPCRISLFVQVLKIIPILSFALRTMYAMDKSGSFVPKTHQEREKVLEQLETALDDWYNTVPEHFRMSEGKVDPRFASHYATIHFVYYFANIITYRPFTLSPYHDVNEASRPLADKAMNLSTAAARSIINLTEMQLSSATSSMTSVLYSSYYAGGQLVLGIWYLKAKEKARKEKKELFRDCHISPPSRSGLQTANYDETATSLADYIEVLVTDLRRLVTMYEKLQGKWDFTQPIVAWLRESLPKDGETEMPEPDNLHPPDIQPFLGCYEQAQVHDGFTSIPTDFPPLEPFVDQSHLQEPQTYSSFPYSNVLQSSLFSDHAAFGSSQAQTSEHPSHSYQTSAGQPFFHRDPVQPREAWSPRRTSMFIPSDLHHSQPLSVTSAQQSVSGLSGLHQPPQLVGSQNPQSSSVNYQGWYGSTPLYPEQQYGTNMAGERRYYTEHTRAEAAAPPQMQQGQSSWVNQPALSPQQHFRSYNEPAPLANVGPSNIQYPQPWHTNP